MNPTPPRRRKLDWREVHDRLARVAAATERALAPTPEQALAIMNERARTLALVPPGPPGPSEFLEIANFTLALERYATPWLKPDAERGALAEAVKDYGIRTGNLDSRASSLSGGNQQKLALAKVLQPQPKIVVLDEPTRGVDVGAKTEIYALVNKLAEAGKAVLVISSEHQELFGLCDRVLVMREGEIRGRTVEHTGRVAQAFPELASEVVGSRVFVGIVLVAGIGTVGQIDVEG